MTDQPMSRKMIEAATVLARAKRVFALTGAGVSAESGVPTFRGDQGLWRQYRPEELATPEAFARDPLLVWEWYAWRQGMVRDCEPNPGHFALVRMEDEWPEFLLVTQNVDGLHRRAGSRRILEMHGNIFKARGATETSPSCEAVRQAHAERGSDTIGAWWTVQDFRVGGTLPPACSCGGLLRPHIVWFGEQLDPDVVGEAFSEAGRADVLLSIGTSSQVAPANRLAAIAAGTGARVIEINPQATSASNAADIVLRGASGEVLPHLLDAALKRRVSAARED